MSVTKVVKVEDVDDLAGFQSGDRDSKALLPVQDEDQVPLADSSLDPAVRETDLSLVPAKDEEGESDAELEEAKDKVYALPENWPKLPQIFRRRSCELTKAASPCVNKAVSHLELLQNIIDDYFKDKEEALKSSESARAVSGKKELRFGETQTRESHMVRRRIPSSAASRPSTRSEVGTTPSLSVQGVGVHGEVTAEDNSGVPFLGAEDVIDEVLTLLARLENDRHEAEEALELEKQRVVRLHSKIDALCLKRMNLLPAVVQKEHEECIMDLNELQWHVEYSSRNQARIQDRTEIADVLNKRLKEDIAFVKRHIPLVEEKLELELEAMDKIRNAQNDTDVELGNTKTRQEKTEAKSNEALDKAQTERGHIKKELDTVRDALTSISEELSEAKMTYNSYTHQINDMEQQLKDNEQELQVLEVKNENARAAEEIQDTKVKDVQKRIKESELEHTRLENENFNLQKELNEKKSTYSLRIMELEKLVKSHDNKLRRVLLKNQEVDMEVQDFIDKIEQCKRQKVSDEKNVVRIHKEMQKIAQQMNVTNEEFNRVANINQNIRDQLNTEQEKTFKMEESLKITAETLRRQVKEEVHTRSVLNSRITSDTEELTRSREDISMKKSKAKKVADEVVEAVSIVKAKVNKLKSAKKEKSEKRTELRKQAEETKRQKVESENRFNDRLKQVEPHHSHLTGDLLKVKKRLDHIEWKSEMMTEKMNDMDKAQGMMDRLVATSTNAIKTVGEELEEITIQLEAQQKMDDDLKASFDAVLARIRSSEATHRAYKASRDAVLRDLEEEKAHSLQLNKELASRYRTLQNHYMVMKDKLMNIFDDRVKVENAKKDLRQLQALQMRMHTAMQEYYKYRGLYSEAELSRMKEESHMNGVKVSELQENMDTALANITDFLKTQLNGETSRKMAWEAVQKQEVKAAKKARAKARKEKSILRSTEVKATA